MDNFDAVCLLIVVAVVGCAVLCYVIVGAEQNILEDNADTRAQMAAMELRLTEKIEAIEKLPLWWEREAEE